MTTEQASREVDRLTRVGLCAAVGALSMNVGLSFWWGLALAFGIVGTANVVAIAIVLATAARS